MRAVVVLVLGVGLIPAVRADDIPASAKVAVTLALTRVEAGATNYPEHRQCFSCHHQAMAMLSLTAARRAGFATNADLVREVEAFSLKTFRGKESAIRRGQGVGGDSVAVVYALHAFAAVGRPYDKTTAALVEYLLVKQRGDGSWPIPPGGDRPPTMGSPFTHAGLAMLALKRHGPPRDAPGAAELQGRIDAAAERGLAWLLANAPSATEDRVFHLRGLVDGGADLAAVERAVEGLLHDQRADGGWAQLPRMDSDAYATATALVAMRHAGLAATHPAYRRGVKYLLATQRDDGAWLVQTRSRPLQVYFDNGDVGGKSQFVSFAATNWAVLALLEVVDPPPARPHNTPWFGPRPDRQEESPCASHP